MLITPHPRASGATKRPHSEISGGDGGEGTAPALPGRSGSTLWSSHEAVGMSELCLSYSPYHRRPHTKRAAGSASHGGDQEGDKTAACYIVNLPGLPGKLDIAKAMSLGVPQGPLLGKLVKGETVTLPDGTTVSPEQCVATGKSSGCIFVVDCPTEAHVASLSNHPSVAPLLASAPSKDPPLLLIVHMTSRAVVQAASYAAFAAKFPSHATHLVLDQALAPRLPIHCASERYVRLFPPSRAVGGAPALPRLGLALCVQESIGAWRLQRRETDDTSRSPFCLSAFDPNYLSNHPRLLHSIAPAIFPLSPPPYDELSKRGNVIAGSLQPAGDSSLKDAVAAWPLLRCVKTGLSIEFLSLPFSLPVSLSFTPCPPLFLSLSLFLPLSLSSPLVSSSPSTLPPVPHLCPALAYCS